jgi:hypothetical protein
LGTLVRAYLLSQLAHVASFPRQTAIDGIAARAQMLGHSASADLIDQAAHSLAEEGLINLTGTDDWLATLSQAGKTSVSTHAATGRRLAKQFVASFEDRARRLTAADDKINRIALVAEQFVEDCLRRRALGVALTVYPWAPGQQEYQLVGLLRTLPTYMEKLLDDEEAILLSRLVRAVLSNPTEGEAVYIGLRLQAVFAVHLLGYDSDTIRARRDIFSDTLFLVDANTLIPYLATGADGHDSARYLIRTLSDLQCPVYTLTSLAGEVAEHARWALSRVDTASGQVNVETLTAALGLSGDRSNGFLEGLLRTVVKGTVGLNLWRYLDEVLLPVQPKGTCSADVIVRALRKRGIESRNLDDWNGFEPLLYAERDDQQERIKQRREQRGTYRHERQVRAEAEALILVKYVRTGGFRLDGRDLRGAYFVSNTKVIDDVASLGTPVTMRPDAVLQWLATLRPGDLKDLQVLTSNLISELSTRDFSIVDRSQLEWVFSPMTSRTWEQFREESERHQVLIGQRLGENPEKAFADADPLMLPIVFDSANAQVAASAVSQLTDTEERLKAVQAKARIADRDRERLAKLEQGERQRKRKTQNRQRSAQSKPKRRRRGK